MYEPSDAMALIVLGMFCATQIAYFLSLTLDIYFFSRPINWVDPEEARALDPKDYPHIVLFYPVLRELEATMRTTFVSIGHIEYPRGKFSVVAIPNADDVETVAALRRLQREFPFLQIIEVPHTRHKSWNVVWDSWQRTPKAYWWHKGKYARDRNLPPKKTRQLIYAFYQIAQSSLTHEDFLVNYIDADSCPPSDHFLAAAAGMQHYDVLQAQNIAGNLNASMASSWHAFDHMAWDGLKYPHLSADGKHPYWVLGKGLYFRASDLLALGGFHPWITIEDPEVGMRFWTNGKRLGIIANPLIEEVPLTFAHGITQRKRWVAGFFQSLATPLASMGMRRRDRFKAWLNFLPCLSLSLNSIGTPLGIWAFLSFLSGNSQVPDWVLWLAVVNLVLFGMSMTRLYVRTWQRTAMVLSRRRDRIWYLLRVNPVFVMVWWLIWLIPLWIGFRMFLRDEGLVWERTEKSDANHKLVRATRIRKQTSPEKVLAGVSMELAGRTAVVQANHMRIE
ncbi:MAG TPA: glycosyltransferase family 2 protein [Devosia sp.]|jgi:cellulose synthase/poly-beta-1,6-N-acetylglucosamine synthase-like glycosyltransferase|nr:glycosyltransferase family 2 protein [Devosia sp.]